MVDRLALRLLLLVLFCPGVQAVTPMQALDLLEMRELAASYSEDQVDRLLGDQSLHRSVPERRALAALVSLGVLAPSDCSDPIRVESKVNAYLHVAVGKHPARVGRLGDVGLPLALDRDWRHDLLADGSLVDALASRLASGVITGYDVRERGVYEGFPSGETFIYSHSSLRHLRQLLALLVAEDLSAWVYATPKVAAFLYRDDWGGASDKIRTLASGIRVLEDKEVAVLFHFDSALDRNRFHELVLAHAKRDAQTEAGLLADAWWQPFYYTDAPLEGFEPISLVILAGGNLEATLTVPLDRTALVVEAFADAGFQQRVQQVWVNPAFHRFLLGDFK